ncbi:hypothetical protein SLA2020_192770 [Shorea laevis]
MEYRFLDITLISAEGLEDVNRIFLMNVYAVVTINGDAQTEQKTRLNKHCGPNPKWNFTMKLAVDEAATNLDGLNLVIRLVSDRHGHPFAKDKDKYIGKVVVSIKEFLASEGKVFVRNVMSRKGNLKGTLNLRSTIGEKFCAHVAAPPPVVLVMEYLATEPISGYTDLPQFSPQQPPQQLPQQPAGGCFGRVLFSAIAIVSTVLDAVDI